MGMDMTLGYFYKLIVEQIPVCEKENIRCFIMDDRGYLIAHKGNCAVDRTNGTQKRKLVIHVSGDSLGWIFDDRISNQSFRYGMKLVKIFCNAFLSSRIQV